MSSTAVPINIRHDQPTIAPPSKQFCTKSWGRCGVGWGLGGRGRWQCICFRLHTVSFYGSNAGGVGETWSRTVHITWELGTRPFINPSIHPSIHPTTTRRRHYKHFMGSDVIVIYLRYSMSDTPTLNYELVVCELLYCRGELVDFNV